MIRMVEKVKREFPTKKQTSLENYRNKSSKLGMNKIT